MKAIYNSRILAEEEINLPISNRAFCYGDGLFETIVTEPDRINLIHLHIARLAKACHLLEMTLPFDENTLKREIEQLRAVNTLVGQTRVRVQLWRNKGGLYTPKEHSTSYLLTIAASDKPFFSAIEKISISQNSKVSLHALSFAKTMSAMPYVVAGLEKSQSDYDDLIITDNIGNIAECIASNVFWTNGKTILTPAISTGCVNGTMRQYLISKFGNAGIEVQEVLKPISSILEAEHLFICNASGIQWVKSFEEKATYSNPHALLEQVTILPRQL